MPTKQKVSRAPREKIQDLKTKQWVEGLRIGLAIPEGAGSPVDADRIQILDAEGKVLFTTPVDSARR